MEDSEFPYDEFDEKIHASAVHYLIHLNKNAAATAFLTCSFKLVEEERNYGVCTSYGAQLRAPQSVYDLLNQSKGAERIDVVEAVEAALPFGVRLEYFIVKLNLVEVVPDWKAQMLDIVLGKDVHNQGVTFDNRTMVIWQTLLFRSRE